MFRAFSRSDKVAAILKSLGYVKPVPVQSMYIFKQPRIGGEVWRGRVCASALPLHAMPPAFARNACQ